MIFTLSVSFVGIALSYGLGTGPLGLDGSQVLTAVLVSQLASFLGLLITTRAERTPWIRKNILTHGAVTWLLIIAVFSGCLLLLVPALRDRTTMAVLFLPLLMSDGFAILAFGPLQDYLVKRDLRQSQLVATKSS